MSILKKNFAPGLGDLPSTMLSCFTTYNKSWDHPSKLGGTPMIPKPPKRSSKGDPLEEFGIDLTKHNRTYQLGSLGQKYWWATARDKLGIQYSIPSFTGVLLLMVQYIRPENYRKSVKPCKNDGINYLPNSTGAGILNHQQYWVGFLNYQPYPTGFFLSEKKHLSIEQNIMVTSHNLGWLTPFSVLYHPLYNPNNAFPFFTYLTWNHPPCWETPTLHILFHLGTKNTSWADTGGIIPVSK